MTVDPLTHAGRIARIRKEREQAGREPMIQTPTVYAVLDSLLTANQSQDTK